jgi:CheY-like chemotaxis protein
MKLKVAKNAAEEANTMKSSFLASMSHEIRTPLNSILGFAQILYEEERDAEKLEKLEIIKNAGSHLLSLVNNVLEFSKIEAGKIEIERRSFSIHKLMDDLQKMFSLKALERNLSWEVHLGPTVPEIIVGDEHRIMQVLVNLTGNAFKFTEFGGVFIRVSYQDGQLEILVKDTGIGIPEEKQEAIFSAFEQVDASHARKYAGTGLGLSITKNLLDLMGGTISIKKSTVGGSEFLVSLPAETVERFEEDQESAVLSESEPNLGERLVLLVVDRNESADIEAIMNIVQLSSLEGVCMEVLPFDPEAKDKILVAGADLVLLYEDPENCTMKRLAKDLKEDFRTSFLPILLLKAGSGEQISFQPDLNTQKYGKASQEEGFYGFIRQVLRGREVFGETMVKGWLEKLEVDLGSHEILLESLKDIVSRVESLEAALVDQAVEDIKFLTHSLKGGTGTLRMKEVSQKLAVMEAELRKVPLDMERVRKEFSSVKEMVTLIPKKYFVVERFKLEKKKDVLNEFLILIVDDNMENQKLIGHLLNRLNLKHKNAENGAVALEMLHAEEFDLVLLDAQMPIMDGITTLKRIREDSALQGLRVIMQSASIFEEDIREFFRAGCDDYIAKPVDLGLLQRKLEEIIAGNHP